jgi:hypothetical protein
LAAQSDVLLFHGDAPGSLEVAGQQHLAIADAIAEGEPGRASQLMIEHIDTTRHQFERKIRDRLFNVGPRTATSGHVVNGRRTDAAASQLAERDITAS